MWCAHDDQWEQNCIEKLLEALLKNPESGLAFSGIKLIDENENLISEKSFSNHDNPNNWSQFKTALKSVSPSRGKPKMNYAMYGLFRSSSLESFVGYIRDMAMWDRIFVIMLSLYTPFTYDDEYLYIRTIQKTKANIRYTTDNYALEVKNNIFWRVKMLKVLFVLIITCKLISFKLKLVSPIIIVIYAWSNTRNVLGKFRKKWKNKIRLIKKFKI